MKILFTGGGTGGHFYPIIAIAQEIKKICEEEKLSVPELYFMADNPYNPRVLFENNITFVPVSAGKLRRYFSLLNLTDFFKTAFGIIQALWKVYSIYPDVVFSKGGYSSFPCLFAARILNIPVIIHESDSHPGRVNSWSAKFARRIAVSYPDAAKYFPANKVAVTGNPLRHEVMNPTPRGAYEFLQLDRTLPVIMVLGGSQGAAKINDAILDILPKLVERFQIVHQTGRKNFEEVKKRADYLLKNNPFANRYRPFDYLNESAIRMVAGIADLVISRAGSTIFEIAYWGIPSIIIPIPPEISHDQTSNAYTYARSGSAVVIEEKNLRSSILYEEIDRLMSDPNLLSSMKQSCRNFARPDANRTIAKEIINIALTHED
jgi:UDP-N-acetylglucosamine--N-acetylmuramyl-(pentapeptide) pyrophosphoryl-undecaprenol N-acetylglucosamine transferase